MTNRILCQARETRLKLNFFQLVLRYRFWDSILILMYRWEAHDLKKTEMLMRQSDKKTLAFEYEFSLKIDFPIMILISTLQNDLLQSQGCYT